MTRATILIYNQSNRQWPCRYCFQDFADLNFVNFHLQVCEGQIHFARMYDGEKRPLPCFHGVRGPEVVRSLLEIEATFEKNLQILKDVKKTILDVKVIKIIA